MSVADHLEISVMPDDRGDLVERADELIGETKELIARLLAKSDQLVQETAELSGRITSLSARRVG
jgi:hypothetical protein